MVNCNIILHSAPRGQTGKGGTHLTAYQIFLIAVYLFFFGSIAGWVLELLFRRFFSGSNPEHLWLNPGFLFGPCVPLYGIGTVVLFGMSLLESAVFGSFSGSVGYYFVMFFIMALVMTLIEYLVGLLSIRVMGVRLWDYSRRWGNVQGIICPLFTCFWGVLSAVYYFLLYPRLLVLVEWFVAHPLFSFFVGICFGVFVIDFAFSLHLGTQLHRRAAALDRTLYESIDLQKLQKRLQSRSGFFRLGAQRSLSDRLDAFDEFLHRRPGAPAPQSAEGAEK